jgi:hypothetical protein
VSPGMIEIIRRTGLLSAVYPVLMSSATGVPAGIPGIRGGQDGVVQALELAQVPAQPLAAAVQTRPRRGRTMTSPSRSRTCT